MYIQKECDPTNCERKKEKERGIRENKILIFSVEEYDSETKTQSGKKRGQKRRGEGMGVGVSGQNISVVFVQHRIVVSITDFLWVSEGYVKTI